VKSYQRILVPLLGLTFVLGGIVIVAGYAVQPLAAPQPAEVSPRTFLSASSLLFASYIGFDSIAQAGGEARDPGRTLPIAIALSIAIVGVFYMLFTGAVYHAVPWQQIAAQANLRDVTAPGLLGARLPRAWTVAIVAGAAVALAKDLPAMLLGVSRLMFAWAEDGVFPRAVAAVHPRWRTPHVAIVCSAAMATLGIVGSHLARDFFVGVDILVTSMLVNFILMCLSVLALPRRNPLLAREVKVLRSRPAQVALSLLGIAWLGAFLVIHTVKDLRADVAAWYFRSTPVWLLVMALGSVIYLRERRALERSGADVERIFASLPPE